MKEKQFMEDHVKKLVNGLNYDYVTSMESKESAEEVTISIEFSAVQGLGELLGGKPRMMKSRREDAE